MLFNSYQFLIFFPVVTALYFLFPKKYKWLLLLLASCIFYMAFIPKYILILFALIIVDYTAGILIEKSQNRWRRFFLIVSLCVNIGLLVVFKYFNFFTSNIDQVASFFHIQFQPTYFSLVLPLGLSFHTFQSLSYVIEVYKKKYKAEKHLGIYALYVMFYPQLVSGPIERPQHLIGQFYKNYTFKYQRVITGLRLILWGLFKKMVIADRLGIFVDQIYANPSYNTGLFLLIATIFFSIQIYCDFSGYTDWWFRDYVYIPLGGNRVKQYRHYINLMVLFLLSGFWHGAAWTFIFWGLLHGTYVLVYFLTVNIRKRFLIWSGLHRLHRIRNLLEITTTFTMVTFAWIFFRASSLNDAFFIVTHLFSVTKEDILALLHSFSFSESFLLLLAFILFIWFIRGYKKKDGFINYLSSQPILVRWTVYTILTILIMNRGVTTEVPFIYFQF